MAYNSRQIKSAFHRALRDYQHEVWYTHYSGEHPVYYVKIYDMSDYDDDDAAEIFDALESVENQFDLDQDYSEGHGDITYSYIDFNN